MLARLRDSREVERSSRMLEDLLPTPLLLLPPLLLRLQGLCPETCPLPCQGLCSEDALSLPLLSLPWLHLQPAGHSLSKGSLYCLRLSRHANRCMARAPMCWLQEAHEIVTYAKNASAM